MNMIFRPQHFNKLWLLRERRKGSPWAYGINFQRRYNYKPVHWSNHQTQFSRRFHRLHYLACHSPETIQKKWKHVYKNFMKKHFADNGNASIRFINLHTCYKWM
jgi:hypothetical protein